MTNINAAIETPTSINEETPMTTYTPFSATRKAMIAHLKSRLTDRENIKLERNEYGNRIRKLFFQDYVIYAALRGADVRKTSHMPDGDNAIEELKRWTSISKPSKWMIDRYLVTEENVQEFNEIMNEALKACTSEQ